MRAAGVRTIVDAARLSVVGLVEVLAHIPRIYGEYRKLKRAIASERPDFAILTDSPDFHIRLAARLKEAGVPVIYLIAPQVWAWRQGRVKTMRRIIDLLLCIFPFEEEFFRSRGVNATFIGHPLSRIVKETQSREAFFANNHLTDDRPLVAVLPGSREGEIGRHLPIVLAAVDRIVQKCPATVVLGLPQGFGAKIGNNRTFSERIRRSSIQVIEGQTWDLLAYADVALAASGTVTIEAAFLGAPLVTFYRVTKLSWIIGRHLVKVPFFSMVNLVAGRRVVPELIQDDMTAAGLAGEALRLLEDSAARAAMRAELGSVAKLLWSANDPMENAVREIEALLRKKELIERELTYAS